MGTGNLLLTINALSLPGLDGPFGLGLAYNSTVGINPFMGNAGRRLAWSLGSAGTLTTSQGFVFFNGPDGSIQKFTPVPGSSTAYTSPAGVLADLVKADFGWTLTSRTTAKVVTFNSDGLAVQVADRNGNNTLISWTAINKPAKVVSTRGSSGARTATMTYDSAGMFSGITQTVGGVTRTATFTFDTQRNITSFTDMAGKTTLFSYTNYEHLSTITSPTGALTTITQDSDGRVTQLEKTNTTVGSPGTSITRLSYPSSTQTLVAGPNTNPAVAVAAGPHTTYTLNSAMRVTAVTDPMGRAQAKTYTGDFATLTATRGTGTTAGTTTNTYGANSGQSLTKSQAPGGAKTQLAYTNTAAATKYLPSSTTSDAGNQSLFTYNGAGNALTSSDALAATATLTYNTDGTVATALAPGNGTNKTLYGYNANHELTTITPVTGTSLASSTFTYDGWGRPHTVTTAGKTATHNYDALGRLTQTSFSDYTPTISYTYNDDGQLTTRVDGSGTTSYGYDQMGRLISRANTAGGGTITYGYDKASNLTSTTDTRGTTSYTYDDSGVPAILVYLLNGVPKTLAFATDDQGRRTDTWLEANATHTSWKARTHADYDTSGRVSRVTAAQGTGDSSNTLIMDLSYCHAAGTTAPTCTTTTANDRANIQWIKNNLNGDITTYTYDGANRLTKAAITGGTTPAITYNYSYDVRGNRLGATTTGATTTNQSFTANAANQISTTGYSYDGSGNLIQDPQGSYSYNAAGQMTTVTKAGTNYTRSYAGSGQNELITQKNPGANFTFTYGRTDANGQPIIEQINRNNSTAYVEHDPVTGEPLMLRTSSGMQSLYVYDGTGNPLALITSEAYIAFANNFDPFGVLTIASDTGGNGQPQNPYAFKNGIQDRTTGWVKYGARYYQPTNGRWSQQDTLDTPLNPVNANRYAYAANNPTNYADPTGFGPAECLFNASAAVFSALVVAGTGAAAVATGGLAIVGLIGAIGLEATTAAAAGWYCGELIQ